MPPTRRRDRRGASSMERAPPQEVENPLAGQHGGGGTQTQMRSVDPKDVHLNPRWLLLKEKAQEELRDAKTGQLVFRYGNGDPVPLDWCFVMRLEGPPTPTYPLPDEACEIIERLFKAGLYVKHHIGREKRQLFIQIGATLPMMMHEATVYMDLQMTVKGDRPCRGTISFHKELVHQFQSKEDFEEGKEFRFNSGQRQLIVMHLIKRLAHIDPYAKVRAKSRFELLLNCKKKSVHKSVGMQRWAVTELLEANSCTTMTSMQTSTTLRLPVCMKLYNKLQVDTAVEVATHGQANPGERVCAADCRAVVVELEAKTLGDAKTIEEVMRNLKDKKLSRGRTTFVCRMTHCYPLHDKRELEVLAERWADFKNMSRWEVPWAMDQGTRVVSSWGMFYQPTTLVREYFGDHVALYFAWLQMYTRWLRFAAATGALTMLGNYMAADGIDSNPLVLAYSIFLSLWSTLFNEAWLYRQKELQFLWGTSGYEEQEQPRPQFRGVVEEDAVTHRKVLVHENPMVRYGRLAASMSVMSFMIVAVIIGALGAFAIRHTDPTVHEKCFNPCIALEMDWAATKFEDNWGDFRFVEEKEDECVEVFVSTYDSEPDVPYCVFLTAQPGQEHGSCRAADFWTNATLCELVDLTGDDTALDREACEAITSCSYTSYSVGGFEDPSWLQANRWKLYSSLLNLVLIQGGGQIYEKTAGALNYWENHRTETEYTDNLIAKVMMFQFVSSSYKKSINAIVVTCTANCIVICALFSQVNNYFTLFYIAFLINIPFFDGMQTGCDGRSCMAELQWQLLIVFTGKTVAKKAVEMAKPFVYGYRESVEAKKAAPADSKTGEEMFSAQCEKERYLAEYGADRFPGTFADFQEMVIQFGYVTMFAASFPLAGLFAMLNNIFEMRSDAWLLCVGHQRPPFKPQEDLGSWETVLFVVSIVNTMVNAGLTAFVGAQLDDSGGTFTSRIRNPRLWAIAVLIEHAVLASKFILKTLTPSEPDWISGAKEALEFRQNQPDDLMPASVKREREAMQTFATSLQDGETTVVSADAVTSPGVATAAFAGSVGSTHGYAGSGYTSVSGAVAEAASSDARVEAAQRVIGETCKTLQCDRATIYLLDPPSPAGTGTPQELVSYVATGNQRREIRIGTTAGLAGACFTSGQLLVVSDPYTDSRFSQAEDLKTGYRTRNVLCIPIKDGDSGAKIGVLQALNKRSSGGDNGGGSAQGHFTAFDESAAYRLSTMAAVAVKVAIAQDTISTFAAASNKHGHIHVLPPPVRPRPLSATFASASASGGSLRQRQPPPPPPQQQAPPTQQPMASFVGAASSAVAMHAVTRGLQQNASTGLHPQQPRVSAQDLSHNRETWL